jgi:hypothetical protein
MGGYRYRVKGEVACERPEMRSLCIVILTCSVLGIRELFGVLAIWLLYQEYSRRSMGLALYS